MYVLLLVKSLRQLTYKMQNYNYFRCRLQDFDDILGTVREEDDHVMVPPTVDVERYVPALSPSEIRVLGRMHEQLFVTHTTTPWYAYTAPQTRVDDRQLVPPLTRATSLLALLGSQLSLVFGM